MRYLLIGSLLSFSAVAQAAGTLGGCQLLPSDNIFNTPINALPADPNSVAFVNTLGSDPGNRHIHLDMGMQMDSTKEDYYGIPYNVTKGSTITWKVVNYKSKIVYDDAEHDSPAAYPDESECANATSHAVIKEDCHSGDVLPFADTPLVEGGIATDSATVEDHDHHLLTVETDSCTLWESWHVYKAGAQWDLLSSTFFDLSSNALRPEGLTSSDEAGFPILPLLLRADEASSGTIAHALRFTLDPDSTFAAHIWPARHGEGGKTDAASYPAIGQLYRIKSSYMIPASFNTQSKAILQALKTYGMYLSDGGTNIFVQGEPSNQWQPDTFDEVQSVAYDEFEAVDITAITSRAGFDSNSGAVPGAVVTGGGGTAGSGGGGGTSTGSGTSAGTGSSSGAAGSTSPTTGGGSLPTGSGSTTGGSATAGGTAATSAAKHGCSSSAPDTLLCAVASLLLSVRSKRQRAERDPKSA